MAVENQVFDQCRAAERGRQGGQPGRPIGRCAGDPGDAAGAIPDLLLQAGLSSDQRTRILAPGHRTLHIEGKLPQSGQIQRLLVVVGWSHRRQPQGPAALVLRPPQHPIRAARFDREPDPQVGQLPRVPGRRGPELGGSQRRAEAVQDPDAGSKSGVGAASVTVVEPQQRGGVPGSGPSVRGAGATGSGGGVQGGACLLAAAERQGDSGHDHPGVIDRPDPACRFQGGDGSLSGPQRRHRVLAVDPPGPQREIACHRDPAAAALSDRRTTGSLDFRCRRWGVVLGNGDPGQQQPGLHQVDRVVPAGVLGNGRGRGDARLGQQPNGQQCLGPFDRQQTGIAAGGLVAGRRFVESCQCGRDVTVHGGRESAILVHHRRPAGVPVGDEHFLGPQQIAFGAAPIAAPGQHDAPVVADGRLDQRVPADLLQRTQRRREIGGGVVEAADLGVDETALHAQPGGRDPGDVRQRQRHLSQRVRAAAGHGQQIAEDAACLRGKAFGPRAVGDPNRLLQMRFRLGQLPGRQTHQAQCLLGHRSRSGIGRFGRQHRLGQPPGAGRIGEREVSGLVRQLECRHRAPRLAVVSEWGG